MRLKMNKKVLIAIVVVVILALIGGIVFAVTRKPKEKNDEKEDKKVTSSQNNEVVETAKPENENKIEENINEEEKNMYSTGLHHAAIVIKDYGTIKLELDADVAPITVQNFAKLVNEGFYVGLTFHRIIDGFMIQVGDPEGTGFGGSSENIKGEFLANGVKNTISHVRGTISMARSQAYNSASSQFFIVHEDSTFLNGQYAGFGKVTSGIEIVDKICEDTPVEDDNGTVLKKNQPVIEKITMED